MKKFIAALFTLIFFTCPAYADEGGITVNINGTNLAFEVPPQIIEDRVMVPMRGIFEALGASVNWYEESSLIISTKGADIISMQVGSDKIVVHNVITNESSVYTMDVPPLIIDGSTLVPIRAVSESMGCTVDWDGDTTTVTITAE